MREALNAALLKWAEITGDENGEIANWHYEVSLKHLNEAQDLDPTGLTAAMLLVAIWEKFSASSTINVQQVLRQDAQTMQTLADFRELQGLLENPELVEAMDAFRADVLERLEHYGATQALEMAGQFGALGLLRRDAMRSLGTLRVDQFVQGSPTTTKPRYNPQVFRFPNVQSLVAATLSHGEPGITLCHLTDPEGDVFSYFALSVWNGGTLTVLSDRPNYAHPAQKGMLRKPARMLAERWGQHHFPYHLLEATFSENLKEVTFEPGTGLVRTDIPGYPVQSIWDLEPDVVIWLLMVFEQLGTRYIVGDQRLPELSYTGDLLQSQRPVRNPLIRLAGWRAPVKPVLRSAELTPETTADNWESEPVGHNRWLEEKFRQQVPDSLLNLAQTDRQQLLLPVDSQAVTVLDSISAQQQERCVGFHREPPKDHGLLAMPPTDFGTERELQQDYTWIARYNQAKVVQHLAEADFEEHKQGVLKWFADAVQANRQFVIDSVCRMELKCDVGDMEMFNRELKMTPRNLVCVEYDPSGHCYLPNGVWNYWGDVETLRKLTISGGSRDGGRRSMCAIDPGTYGNLGASVVVPNVPAIEMVTGLPRESFPEPLQHYCRTEPYNGNSILDRLDPMDWVVKDPWRNLALTIRVVLSRSGFNRRRVELGLPKFSDWDSLRHKDRWSKWD